MQRTGCLSFILALMLIFTCFAAVSCGETASYHSDIPVSKLTAAADELLPDSGDFATMTSDYILGMMDIDTSEFAEYTVKLRASGANVDEYGIFKAKSDDDVENVKETVQKYLAMRVDTWMPEYMPEEFPKMQKASVKVMGRYVVYCILDDDAKNDVFTSIENILLGK
ncbi:MAG: DUF4358 domain-containing protein [Clostridia bacterium]|nr:DUF4358 domain-containing protein [Clostridia bacterium]